jgi:hypothetical protein
MKKIPSAIELSVSPAAPNSTRDSSSLFRTAGMVKKNSKQPGTSSPKSATLFRSLDYGLVDNV